MADILGSFEQAVLLSIVRLGREAYGRGIHAVVQQRLDRQVSPGAVHATLDRLERKGLVSSSLGTGSTTRDGRARRYYSVEAAGVTALNDARRTLNHVWSGLNWPLRVRG
jgi:PadR family transcriptional regulator, regulatory protein PadR